MSRSRKRKLSGGPALETAELKRLRLLVHDLQVQLRDTQKQVESLTETRPKTHIDDLPDGLMVRVLAELDPLFVVDVVAVVCRRWRTLARDPALWEDKVLQYGNKGQGSKSDLRQFVRVLAAAPVLDSLECGLSPADPSPLLHALETCCTAVSHLCLDLDVAAPEAVLQLMYNSRERLTIFCLREGPISACFFNDRQANRFWQLVEDASRAKLCTLVLFLSQRSRLASTMHCFRLTPRSSLRTLFVDVALLDESHVLNPALAITLSSLVHAHRATLSDVHLPMRVPPGNAVVALSRCQNLDRVSLPATMSVAALAGCPQLQHLRITMNPGQQLDPQAVMLNVALMRHLRVLRVVQLPPRSEGDEETATEVVRIALAELAELREVWVTCLPTADVLRSLADSVGAAGPHFEALGFGEGCDAAGCRLDAFRRLLDARPNLHVLQSRAATTPQCDAEHRRLADGDLPADRPVAFVLHDGPKGCRRCEDLLLSGSSVLRLCPLHPVELRDNVTYSCVPADDAPPPQVSYEMDPTSSTVESSPPIMVSIPLRKLVTSEANGVAESTQTAEDNLLPQSPGVLKTAPPAFADGLASDLDVELEQNTSPTDSVRPESSNSSSPRKNMSRACRPVSFVRLNELEYDKDVEIPVKVKSGRCRSRGRPPMQRKQPPHSPDKMTTVVDLDEPLTTIPRSKRPVAPKKTAKRERKNVRPCKTGTFDVTTPTDRRVPSPVCLSGPPVPIVVTPTWVQPPPPKPHPASTSSKNRSRFKDRLKFPGKPAGQIPFGQCPKPVDPNFSLSLILTNPIIPKGQGPRPFSVNSIPQLSPRCLNLPPQRVPNFSSLLHVNHGRNQLLSKSEPQCSSKYSNQTVPKPLTLPFVRMPAPGAHVSSSVPKNTAMDMPVLDLAPLDKLCVMKCTNNNNYLIPTEEQVPGQCEMPFVTSGK